VIARKISCGNKTQKGARTWQILTSLAATCAQRTTSFIAELSVSTIIDGEVFRKIDGIEGSVRAGGSDRGSGGLSW
jgi:hypothetical protein